ncbi:MAG: tetratricopeptide repeat protein [Chlorobi bacterium]|nr:tetratricopeptide repeat protein [Chlorobiota bacterium]
MSLKRKVLLIGWDAADWKIINKLIAKGQMPSMHKFLQTGVYGNIATLDPPFSPMLWTTIATGVRPDKHGILGFTEPDTAKSGVRPVSSVSRKVKAIWNILTHEGYKTHSVGWWPSHPAEPVNGIMISNHYQKMNKDKPVPLLKGTVYPKKLSPLFSHFRIHPHELTQEHLLPFVPDAAKIDQQKDKRLSLIAKNIAECSSIHAAATWILENQEWDFLSVYLDTIDHFCHGFMNFHPPKMQNVSDKDFELYKDVVNSAYRYHDMMLGRLLELAGEDATVIIVSDHGFHSDHLRPNLLPDEPAGPAYQHRDYGIFCMKGPGIKKGERIYGASLLDVTPTLLTLYDLPVGKDMDGVPLVQSFVKQPEIKIIPSWEDVEGEFGMHPKEFREDPYDAHESLKQLVELGYIEEPSEDIEENVSRIIKESEYNLARVYIGARRYDKALRIFEKLNAAEPEKGRFAFRLIECYKYEGNIERCEEILSEFREKIKDTIIPDSEMKKIAGEKIPENISENEKEILSKKRYKKMVNNRRVFKELLQADLIEGELLILKGKFKEALEKYYKIQKVASQSISLNIKIANAFLKLEKWEEALQSFNKVLELDPENYVAFHGKAIAFLRKGDYEKSVDSVLDSINLLYNNPMAHYLLGEALFKYGDYENAEKAFNICLAMAPDIGKARNTLIEIYEKHLKQPEKAEHLKEYFKNSKNSVTENTIKEDVEFIPDVNLKTVNLIEKKANNDTVIVVSGLPRSGTSLMMQILEKAGIDIFSDSKRKPDENNPKGYYEHEAVKRLARDKGWLKQTQGKAVKIIAQLLFALPDRYNYKIIFMNRNINEILISQHKMLAEQGKVKPDMFSVGLQNAFLKTLERTQAWAEKKHNVEILYINHRDLILNPNSEVEKVATFTRKNFNIKDAASVVDQKLYRVKVK